MKIKQVRLILDQASELYRKANNPELADAIHRLSIALKIADNQEVSSLAADLSKFHKFK